MAEVGRLIGVRLCEAWGLDPSKVARIVIDIGPGDIVQAQVSIYVDDEVVDQLIELRAR